VGCRRANLARYQVSPAQSKAPDLRGRDVDVLRARQETLLPEQAKSTVGNIEHSGTCESPLLIRERSDRSETFLFSGC